MGSTNRWWDKSLEISRCTPGHLFLVTKKKLCTNSREPIHHPLIVDVYAVVSTTTILISYLLFHLLMAMTLFQDCEPISVFSILRGEGRGVGC